MRFLLLLFVWLGIMASQCVLLADDFPLPPPGTVVKVTEYTLENGVVTGKREWTESAEAYRAALDSRRSSKGPGIGLAEWSDKAQPRAIAKAGCPNCGPGCDCGPGCRCDSSNWSATCAAVPAATRAAYSGPRVVVHPVATQMPRYVAPAVATPIPFTQATIAPGVVVGSTLSSGVYQTVPIPTGAVYAAPVGGTSRSFGAGFNLGGPFGGGFGASFGAGAGCAKGG